MISTLAYVARRNRCCVEAAFFDELVQKSAAADVYILRRRCDRHGDLETRVTLARAVDSVEHAKTRRTTAQNWAFRGF